MEFYKRQAHDGDIVTDILLIHEQYDNENMYTLQGSVRFTDFGSKQFSVKVAAVKRNAHHLLFLTLIKPFISYFPKDYGLTRVKQRLHPVPHKFIQK